MTTDRQAFVRNLWLRSAGLPELDLDMPLPDESELRRTEWSSRFEQFMRNRLVMGALRYGRIGARFKKPWDRVGSMIQRLRSYERDGNLEHLVDVANLALLEFVEGRHPRANFSSVDDGEHAKEKGENR